MLAKDVTNEELHHYAKVENQLDEITYQQHNYYESDTF